MNKIIPQSLRAERFSHHDGTDEGNRTWVLFEFCYQM